MKSLTISSSVIGGVAATQRVIDFCHQHNIVPEVKLITDKDLDRVYRELSSKNDSIHRLGTNVFIYYFFITFPGTFLILRLVNKNSILSIDNLVMEKNKIVLIKPRVIIMCIGEEKDPVSH